MLDDVRHALGSPDHVSRESVYKVVGYDQALYQRHRSQVQDIRLDRGGTDDIHHAAGWFDAGSGQGCPLSPWNYVPMGEVRLKVVSRAYPRVLTPAGLLHSVAWADDTVWLGGTPADVTAIAKALPEAEDTVPLGSDVVNMHVLWTWWEDQHIRYGRPFVWMNGVQLPVPVGKEHIRLVGRHALPHRYKEAFGKLMTAVSTPLGPSTLRPCNPEGGWHGSVPSRGLPPPRFRCGMWRTFPPSQRRGPLRGGVGWGGGPTTPAHRVLGLVETGRSCILPLGPDMLTTFVLSCTHQLNHPSPLTRASARWGLVWALWWFSPDMPCVPRGLTDCDSHPMDHDRFLRYTQHMDIRIWAVLEDHHVEVPKHLLGIACTTDEAKDAHAAPAAGYCDWSDTWAGWPSRFGGFGALPPWPRNIQWAQEQPSDCISLQDVPDEAVFVQDSTWYPITRLGGAY